MRISGNVSSENLNRLFTFTVEMEMRDEEGRSAKKMKVELYGKRIVCNYATRTGSQQ